MNTKNKINHLAAVRVMVIFLFITGSAAASEYIMPPCNPTVNMLINTGEYSIVSPSGMISSPSIHGAVLSLNQMDHKLVKPKNLQHNLFSQNTFSFEGTDWSNSGGDAQRNGMSDTRGPRASNLLWSGANTSIISWLPVTEDNRLFVVRQKGWPGSSQDSAIFAMDLLTGENLWVAEIPYHTGDWTTWIAGVRNGQVYGSRSGNGASVKDNLYALDAGTGEILWASTDLIDAGPYDGVVFAPNGDPVVASFTDIWRINAVDGTTVWHANRVGSVSGTCGGAVYQDSLYVADVTAGGHIIVRYDLNTGQRLYQSPVMSGFTLQNTPMVGPDGTIYLSRTQNNPSVDFFYAFSDTGENLIEKWHIPCAWTTFSEFTTGSDDSVYLIIPGPRIAKVNASDGEVIAQTDILNDVDSPLAPHFAIDAEGTVYFSNGGFSHGHVSVYTSDLSPLWNTTVTNINIGGPALGKNGVLLVCGTGTTFRAYQRPVPLLEVNATGGFLKIHAVIKNIGEIDATNLGWSIAAQGGVFKRINQTSTGSIPLLKSHEETTVTTTGIIVGFGRLKITLQANEVMKSLDGVVLGPIIFIS
jgi:hypothetical protein